MAGEVHDREARDHVALREGSLDLHRPAVPGLQQQRHAEAREGMLELREVEVVSTAVALGVRHLGRVAEDRHSEAWRRTAVVRVSVAQDHPRKAAETGGDRTDLSAYRPDPRIEARHAI